jgi:hypothetical protein
MAACPEQISAAPTRTVYLGRIVILITAIWAALIVGLAAFHAWQLYSPVPVHYDMWWGYLEFYERATDGDWWIWRSPLNEHRMFLSRLLFWADIHWFRGKSIFLLIADYVILAAIAAIFWRIIGERVPGEKFRTTRNSLRLFTCAWLFLLCQGENLVWAFQGCFFLAFLLPLCALYFLQKSQAGLLTRDFILACSCGVLAAAAMANGVLALPILTACALFLRQDILRVVALSLLCLVVIVLYFHNYSSPGGHSIFAPEVRNNILGAIQFFLALLGNPFSYLFGHQDNLFIAQGFALIFLLGIVYKATRILPEARPDPLQASLLFFVLYILGTVAGITGGRLFLGLKQALIAKYTTPAIMGWAALVSLYSADLAGLRIGWRRLLVAPALALALLMANFQYKALTRYDDVFYGGYALTRYDDVFYDQYKALNRYDDVFFERTVAMLALALGIDDQEQNKTLTAPLWLRMIPPIAEKAYERQLSLFGTYPFQESREQLGAPAPRHSSPSLPACQGALNRIRITTDARFCQGERLVNQLDTRC